MADSDSEPKNILSILDQMANSTQWVKMFPVNVIFIFQIPIKYLIYRTSIEFPSKLKKFPQEFQFFCMFFKYMIFD